eukprot:TRINITY_DN20475_c0_g1_i1.p1 TRINITY_DN20475_c0_g1~~TRINITY_DN20475_c0_g1_i1.p1  ORF type:complete len:408 (+),score=75.15 TRINITY_DN20475_c0_g1_i1:72-1295(+)
MDFTLRSNLCMDAEMVEADNEVVTSRGLVFGDDMHDLDNTIKSNETASDYDSGSELVTRFAEEFQELCVLGCGTYGMVTKVKHKLDGQIYAVKKSLRPFQGRTAKENRLQEAYAGASLPHTQHVVKYYDCWIETDPVTRTDILYIRFEYCEQGDISKIPSWTFDEILELFYQTTLGLHSLHTLNVVHLDIKPDNIYLSTKTNKRVFKLGDLGLVRKVDDAHRQRWVGENDDEGDSRYLCPVFLRENAVSHSGAFTKAADIFSLAATIYEIARGVPLPMSGDQWMAIREHPAVDLEGVYPDEFVSLLKACMHGDPDCRPSTMEVLQNPIFARFKQSTPQEAATISDLESRIRQLRSQISSLSPSTNSDSSPPGLSPSPDGDISPQTPPTSFQCPPQFPQLQPTNWMHH